MTSPVAPTGADKTTLWGVLGIVGAFCCWPAGLVFGILCLLEARKRGRSPTLAYVTFAVLAVLLVLNILAITLLSVGDWGWGDNGPYD